MAFYVRVLTVKNSIKHMLALGKVTGNTGKIEENECSGYSKDYFVYSRLQIQGMTLAKFPPGPTLPQLY